jgi:hypothetical protein
VCCPPTPHHHPIPTHTPHAPPLPPPPGARARDARGWSRKNPSQRDVCLALWGVVCVAISHGKAAPFSPRSCRARRKVPRSAGGLTLKWCRLSVMCLWLSALLIARLVHQLTSR